MSSEPEILPSESSTAATEESGEKISKKAAKKEAAKLEKLRRRQEQEEAARKTGSISLEDDEYSSNYGDVTLNELQSTADPKAGKWREAVEGKEWTDVSDLVEEMVESEVLIRGRVHTDRPVSSKLGFVVLRESGSTVQCVVSQSETTKVGANMVKYLRQLSRESFVDVIGLVVLPKEPLKGTTQQVEIQVRKIYCVNKALAILPLSVEDAARSELDIRKHYSEVMDLVDKLFVFIFTSLNEKCKKELEAVGKQYPFEPLKFLPVTLRLTFAEGVQMLKEAGVEVDPLGDLNTESERKLGQLVLEKYNTEFYILHRYPKAVRPFYTMTCADDPLYSNSFDVFIRGEEIISGAQRVHIPEVLEQRAGECGIDVKTISTYIDSFRYGAPPHGGFGVGLERVVMLFCALNNIRKTSLFPRDPQRLAP